MNIYEESLQFHKQLRGKLEVSSRVKITNEKDLSLYKKMEYSCCYF